MKLQQARRTNPYPWTWEIPIAVVVSILLAMTLVLHAARTLANAVVGGGWQFTPRSELFGAVPMLVTGDATAGLSSAPAAHATTNHLWLWIAMTELVLLVAISLLLRSVLARWGPGRIHGMASAEDAGRLLGRSRLRRDAAIIRPDLHGKRP